MWITFLAVLFIIYCDVCEIVNQYFRPDDTFNFIGTNWNVYIVVDLMRHPLDSRSCQIWLKFKRIISASAIGIAHYILLSVLSSSVCVLIISPICQKQPSMVQNLPSQFCLVKYWILKCCWILCSVSLMSLDGHEIVS